jgi:hypothetical protein
MEKEDDISQCAETAAETVYTGRGCNIPAALLCHTGPYDFMCFLFFVFS